MEQLNIFYAEPDPDRWIKFDRYPRRLVRRLVRGKARPGGVMMVALNLMQGLDKIGMPYRFNDFSYIKKHPSEIACIIGKPHVLFERKWPNPIIFGAGIFSHPVDCPDLLKLYPNIKKVLVPGNWMKAMFEPYYSDKVLTWPTGIDTDYWSPADEEPSVDFLIYDKPLWGVDKRSDYILHTITKYLDLKGLTYTYIKYGSYTKEQLRKEARSAKACIVLSQHETQGLAYQQILSTNTAILAYNPGGYWPDQNYYPHKVKFEPVSSVPYWDERCGTTFTGPHDFESALLALNNALGQFKPREFILDNLSLEKCALKYVDIHNQVKRELSV